MAKGVLKYGALWCFLAGMILLVIIQFLSAKNNDHLNDSALRLRHHMDISGELQSIESEVLSIESDTRGFVITSDSVFFTDLYSKISTLRQRLELLRTRADDSATNAGLDLVTGLVQSKLAFTEETVKAYARGGKDAAEE
ncbi:MAG: CHASE3 domain-containing protein, partial [Chitinophagaceae bacterium]